MTSGAPGLWIIAAGAVIGALLGLLVNGLVFGFRRKEPTSDALTDLVQSNAPPSRSSDFSKSEADVKPPRADLRATAESLIARGIHLEDKEKPEAAREEYLRALAIFEGEKDPSGVRRVCDLLASLHLHHGDLDGAESYWRYALSLATVAGDKSEEAQIMERLGALAVERGDLDGATDLLGETLRMLEALGDEPSTARLAGELGDLEAHQGHPALAREYWEQALRLAPEGSPLARLCTDTLRRLDEPKRSVTQETDTP